MPEERRGRYVWVGDKMLAQLGRVLCAIAIASIAFVAPVSGEEPPPPAIHMLLMLDGSVQLEGMRYAEPDALRAKLAEIDNRKPKPNVEMNFGELSACEPDPFGPAYELLRKSGFLRPDQVVIESRICGGGPVHLRPIPDVPPLTEGVVSARLDLHVLANGHVRFGQGPELDESGLVVKVQELMRLNPRPEIRLIPENEVPFQSVSAVLNVFQTAGYGPRFGFVGNSK